jgi:hypothetical protein
MKVLECKTLTSVDSAELRKEALATTKEPEFVDKLSHALALATVAMLWSSCSEEIHNVIGVQFFEGTLFVNTLSDMDCSIEKGQLIRWPYLPKPMSEDAVPELEFVGGDLQIVCDKINEWLAKFASYARELNRPTPEAWQAFLALHGRTPK